MDSKDLMRDNDILAKMSQYNIGTAFPVQAGRTSDGRSGTEPAQDNIASESIQVGLSGAPPSSNINLDDLSRQIMIAGMNALGMTNPSLARQMTLGETSAANMNLLANLNIPMSSSCGDNLMNSVPDGSGLMRYRAPDMDLFTFDRNTGYRFDPSTGLHYDANSGFFINVRLKIFMRWDPLSNSYLREVKRPRAGPAAPQSLSAFPVIPIVHRQPSAPTAIFPDLIQRLSAEPSGILPKPNEGSFMNELWQKMRSISDHDDGNQRLDANKIPGSKNESIEDVALDIGKGKNRNRKTRMIGRDDFSKSRSNSPPSYKGVDSNKKRNERSSSRSSCESISQQRKRESREHKSASRNRKRSRSPYRDSKKSDGGARMTSNRRSHSTDRGRGVIGSPARKRSRSHDSRSKSFSQSPERQSKGGKRKADVWPSPHSSSKRQNLTEASISRLQKGEPRFSSDSNNKNDGPKERENVNNSQSNKKLMVSGPSSSSESVVESGGNSGWINTDLICYKCGLHGHLKRDCKVQGRICFCCSKFADHIAADCPESDQVGLKNVKIKFRKNQWNKRELKATEDQNDRLVDVDNHGKYVKFESGNLQKFSRSEKIDVTVVCHKCGIRGHTARNCVVEGRLCYNCMKISDHVSTECPEPVNPGRRRRKNMEDGKHKRSENANNPNSSKSGKLEESRTCVKCGLKGHIKKNCTKKDNEKSNFVEWKEREKYYRKNPVGDQTEEKQAEKQKRQLVAYSPDGEDN